MKSSSERPGDSRGHRPRGEWRGSSCGRQDDTQQATAWASPAAQPSRSWAQCRPGPTLPSCPSAKAENGELAALHPEGVRVTQSPSLTNCLSPGLQTQQPPHPAPSSPGRRLALDRCVRPVCTHSHSRHPAQCPGSRTRPPWGLTVFLLIGTHTACNDPGHFRGNGPQRHPELSGSRKPHTSVAVP